MVLWCYDTMGATVESIIEQCSQWLAQEIVKRRYGKLTIEIIVCSGQVTLINKTIADTVKIPLQSKT